MNFRQIFLFISAPSNRLLRLQFSCYLPCHATSDLTPLLCSSILRGPPASRGARPFVTGSVPAAVSSRAVGGQSVNHPLVHSIELSCSRPANHPPAGAQPSNPAAIKASASTHCCIADCSVSSASSRLLSKKKKQKQLYFVKH